MNPSAKGWLNKLLTTVDRDFSDEDVLETIYPKLKLAGFIYGSNVCVALPQYENKDFIVHLFNKKWGRGPSGALL